MDRREKIALYEKEKLAALLRTFAQQLQEEERERAKEIVGPVDEDFLAQPDAMNYSGEWAINKDRQRILQALNSQEETE